MECSEDSTDILRHQYLDLMKKCLTDLIYGHVEKYPVQLRSLRGRAITRLLQSRGLEVVKTGRFDETLRKEGQDWFDTSAHTMIGIERLNNLQFCVEDVLKRNIPGDLIEAGVWRGGATIFMRSILKAYDVTDRVVWVADSFEGLPAPNPDKYPDDDGDVHHTFKHLSIPIDEVKSNFAKYALLDDQVRFLKGWFHQTLPGAPIQQLAVVRLDGDMYESTMDGLVNLYPKLSPGGYIIIDDYGAIPACRKAVHDYREANGIIDEIRRIDWTGVYWQRAPLRT